MTQAQRWSMLAAILGSAMVFLDGTVMNLALPRIGKELPATVVSTLEGQTYAVSGYLAILAALLVLAGALADYYGRRRIFAIGLTGFGISSVLCGLAPTLELLVLFRLLQGATGALLVPGSLAILTALFDGQARARAFGIWASATSATSLIGPVVGGLLVDTVSWRAAFLINVPLVAIALFATIRHMPETKAEGASGSFDWLGAFVAFIAVGGLAFGAIRGQEKQWQDTLAWVSLAIGAVGPRRLPDPDGAPPEPARPAPPVPAPEVRDDQPVDAADLRRPVHDRAVPGPVPAEHGRLLGDGRRDHRPADRHHPHAVLRARRQRGRAHRHAAIPRHRADHHGRRAVLVRAGAGHDRALDAGAGRPVDVAPAAVHPRRRPARTCSCSASGSRWSWRR